MSIYWFLIRLEVEMMLEDVDFEIGDGNRALVLYY